MNGWIRAGGYGDVMEVTEFGVLCRTGFVVVC